MKLRFVNMQKKKAILRIVDVVSFFLCSDSESWEGVEFESHLYSDTLFCITV